MAKRVILSVSSDLVTDQRVHRSASTLQEQGYEVIVCGRVLRSSQPMPERSYRVKRFRLPFERGGLFYAALNLRLFFYLLFTKADILFSNDLDTLLPNYLVSVLKMKPLVYDSHEYYTGVPELQHRPLIKSIWKGIEKFILPKIKYGITVNESIAGLYREEYGTPFTVLRNIPERIKTDIKPKEDIRKELGLPADKKIVILQGAGINIQRGAEEAVEAMQYTDNILLIIAGDGDVVPKLKKEVSRLRLTEKVIFIPKQQPAALTRYTQATDAGLSFDKDTNINYRFSLPNKFFDYIHAGIPVLVSDLPELSRLIRQYNIGLILQNHQPQHIAEMMMMITHPTYIQSVHDNIALAVSELTWDSEKQKLIHLMQSVT